jgi:uncharacterized protein YegJ (DUF2314 family)
MFLVAGCDDKTSATTPGSPQPRAGAATPGTKPAPSGERPITYHDAALLHIGRGSSKIKLWAVTLLTSKVPDLKLEQVRAVVAGVLGEEVAAKLRPPVESGPVRKFDVPTDKFFLSIEQVRRPYPEFDAIMIMDQKILDKDVLAAFGEHCCFIAVEVLPLPDSPRDELYTMLGKVAAALMDDSVVCVHCRDADVYVKPDDEVRAVLRGEGPKHVLDYFMDRRTFAAPKDQMQAGMAEARRRLPEFLDAWKASDAKAMFLAKAKFETNGMAEYMWLTVSDVQDETVTGKLGNKPLHAKHLREGQSVTVPLGLVADWAYVSKGKRAGGFTDPMVRAAVGGG